MGLLPKSLTGDEWYGQDPGSGVQGRRFNQRTKTGRGAGLTPGNVRPGLDSTETLTEGGHPGYVKRTGDSESSWMESPEVRVEGGRRGTRETSVVCPEEV